MTFTKPLTRGVTSSHTQCTRIRRPASQICPPPITFRWNDSTSLDWCINRQRGELRTRITPNDSTQWKARSVCWLVNECSIFIWNYRLMLCDLSRACSPSDDEEDEISLAKYGCLRASLSAILSSQSYSSMRSIRSNSWRWSLTSDAMYRCTNVIQT